MSVMSRLRAYHALLAVLVIAAYVSPEWGSAHAWLGYGVAAVIAIRLVMALTGAPQLGLMRFYPHFEGLKLNNAATHPAISRVLLAGIATCLIGVAGTGIAMDRGRSLNTSPSTVSSTAASQTPVGARRVADEEEEGEHEDGEGGEDEEGGVLGEVHEVLGNALMLLVALHVSYLLLFKRPLARYMLFAGSKTKRNERDLARPTKSDLKDT